MTPSRVRIQVGVVGLSLVFSPLIHNGIAGSAPGRAATIYQRSRTFRVPFSVNPSDQAKRRELQLWVSSDNGHTWKPKDSTTSNRQFFTFEAPQDGEYWLAVRSVDSEGRLHPKSNDQIEPSMKVVIDTKPPKLTIKPEDRSASLASLRWEIHEDHPDLETLSFEYQVEGSKDWLPVPKQRTGWNGIATWDSGYSERLKVRAVVSDRAGNRSEVVVQLPSTNFDGTLMASNTRPSRKTHASLPKLAAKEDPFRGTVANRSERPSQRALAPTVFHDVERSGEPTPPPLDWSIASRDDAQANDSSRDARVLRSAARVAATEVEQFGARRPRVRSENSQQTAMNEETNDAPALEAPQPVETAAKRPRRLIASSDASDQGVGYSLSRTNLSGFPNERTRESRIETDVEKPPTPRLASARNVEPSQAYSFASNTPPSFPRDSPQQTLVDRSKAVEDSIFGDVVPPAVDALPKRPRRATDPEVGTAALTATHAKPPVRAVRINEDPRPPSFGAMRPQEAPGITTIRVAKPQFSLDYALEDTGPSGLAVVELWLTRDGGKTWTKRGLDPDRKPPFDVDLGGWGTFGISLIARDRQGRGESVPSPGDLPQMWVEVSPQTFDPDPAKSQSAKMETSSPESSNRAVPSGGLLRRVFGKG